jgi:condensin complex subunit 2
VDSVHIETHKVLGGLNRTDIDDSEKNKEKEAFGEEKEDEITSKKSRRDQNGESTLEKNIANLDAVKYDLEFDVDPLFQKTSAKFDESGAKGLLLNNLSVKYYFIKQLNIFYSHSRFYFIL